MKTRMMAVISVTTVVLFIAGCGGDKQVKTGFLSDYSKLQRESDSSLRYVKQGKLADYSGFIVDLVEAKFYKGSKAEGKLTDEQVKDLTAYMHSKLVEAVKGAGMVVVYQPAPGVARIRVALTDLEKTDAINMIPQASLLGAGLGGASMEAEVVDSQTGIQIGAVLESGKGSRIPFANLGDWTAAKGVMDGWAKRFQERLVSMREKK